MAENIPAHSKDTQSQAAQAPGRLEIESLYKRYETENGFREVIKDLTLTITEAKVTVVMGPSGCGKSTLINLLAGYEKPTGGRITIDRQTVTGAGPDRLVVFQETALFPWLTTFENVAYGPKIRKEAKGTQLEELIMDLLRTVGLSDFRDKYPSQLSGGMQRRAELVRALVNRPKVMLLDEPFRGLDAMTRNLMRDYYLDLFERHQSTQLFVTSELDEGLLIADRLAIVTNKPGRIKKIMEINLPRPRDDSLRGTTEYLALKGEALELLHEEAVKSFRAGAVSSADFVGAYAAMG
ncbi:MAG: ABC transporter ATP-binding protein [Deltaproteobacteria bacterium]|jgi:NitT/TauT family transport system ATP-binding protein|nr:ABC transporter ATP-binding protein [Deltaproteobacteria bacterium]